MAYPKPLSEKTLARLYDKAGLKREQIDFLRKFFPACANLYGTVFAEDAWSIYQELSSKTETVKLHRRDMYASLAIMRRENLPFYVFEIDEIYCDEPRLDKMRTVVLRDLVSSGYNKFRDVYKVHELSVGKPFYVPKDLLSFTSMPETDEERRLLKLLNNLKSTCPEYTSFFGETRKCPYNGKYLREFSYIDEFDEHELKWLRGEVEGHKGNPKKAEELETKLKSVTAAQYLIDGIKRKNSVGYDEANDLTDSFFEDLTAMGVMLSGKYQLNTLIEAIYDMCNNQHLWCNHGWTPNALAAHSSSTGMPTITFGPGIQKAFAEGAIDKDEALRILHEMGYKTE